MTDRWRTDIEDAIRRFLAENPSLTGAVDVEFLPAPHRPPSRLPEGKMGVYGFCREDCWLKVGKAGPKSQPRWTSHHYWGCALSTLSGSLRSDPQMKAKVGSDRSQVRDWIIRSTHRVNILLPAGLGRAPLSCLEGFLIARLRPRYEGRRILSLSPYMPCLALTRASKSQGGTRV